MFVRPEQVATLVERYDSIKKARVIVNHDGSFDHMHVKIESSEADINGIDETSVIS